MSLLERAVPKQELERRYQTGLTSMLNHIRISSADVVFYPGDSASRMAGELEEIALKGGVALPLGVRVSHEMNRKLYTDGPLESIDLLARLVRPEQRILLADDCTEFGDKLQYYDQLFTWADYRDVTFVAMVAVRKYKFKQSGSPYQVLFHDEELFKYVRDLNLLLESDPALGFD